MHLTLLTILTLLTLPVTNCEIGLDACKPASNHLITRTRSAIYHAYYAYKHNALPKDELRSLTCTGSNTFGGLSVTLVETLDTFVILRDWPEFVWAAQYLRSNLSFNVNSTVSVFETTIRVLGGLLSAHGFLVQGFDDTGFDAWLWWPDYDDSLLYLAWKLAERLLPTFNTPTGIPFGSVHLQHGVAHDESLVASTAAAGTLILEFGTLSQYTGEQKYYNLAYESMAALHNHAAPTGLVGNHINIVTGEWVGTESGIGALIDSFYEYMLKGYILFGDIRLLQMFQRSYRAIIKYIKNSPWYLNVDMWSGQTSSLSHTALSAFFPSLQVLVGLSDDAAETIRAHYTVWRKFGAIPEGFSVDVRTPSPGMANYPLRPEMVESIFYLHWSSDDPVWIRVAEGVLKGLEVVPKVDCGFARVKDVYTHEVEDLMDSFMISETLKYVYLIFQPRDHWTRSGRYVFNTEAHPLRIQRNNDKLEGGGYRWKCRRLGKAETLLPCGYGLAGSDVPVFDTRSLRRDTGSGDVVEQVKKFVQRFGINGLDVGNLFVGRKNTYQVVNIVGEKVVVQKLERGLINECGRIRGRELVKGKCVWK